MIDFENLGYKDITKNVPVSFSECFGETFETLYPYKQRFYKEDDNIIIILKIGIYHNTTDIAGICYYSKGWQKFEVHTLSEYVEEEFNKIINAVKYKIKNS